MRMNRSAGNKLSLPDKRILNRLQEDIPFVDRPWKAVADELNIREDFLIKRIAYLKKQGVIRRISASFAPREINFCSTLAAAKIAPDYIGKAVRKINSYPEVTHNYRRAAEYNLWFALVARSKKRIAQIIVALKKDKNIEKIEEFPATKIYKINVKFTA